MGKRKLRLPDGCPVIVERLNVPAPWRNAVLRQLRSVRREAMRLLAARPELLAYIREEREAYQWSGREMFDCPAFDAVMTYLAQQMTLPAPPEGLPIDDFDYFIALLIAVVFGLLDAIDDIEP